MAIYIKLQSPFKLVSSKENIPVVVNNGEALPQRIITTSQQIQNAIIGLNNTQNKYALFKMFCDLPDVYAPVSYIVDAIKNVPIYHYRNDKIVEDSNVIKLLNNPNQYMTNGGFKQSYFTDLILFGESFINKIKPVGFRDVKQLYILPSLYTKPVLKDLASADFRTNYVSYYQCQFDGTYIEPQAETVFHKLNYNPSSTGYYKGRSVLMSAILTSESLLANYSARVNLYENGGAMAVISAKEAGSVNSDDITAIAKAYQAKIGIIKGKMPHLLSDKPLNAQSISPNLAGLQLNENKLQDYQSICSVLHIPSVLLNDTTNSTYNNMETAIRLAFENVFIPYLREYTEDLSVFLGLPKNEKLMPDFSEISVLQADQEKKSNIMSKMYNDGVISREEYRLALNYDNIDKTPVYFTNNTNTQNNENQN